MAITPARTFRLDRTDRRLLRELARRWGTNQSQAMRQAIRAAIADARAKDIKQPGRSVNTPKEIEQQNTAAPALVVGNKDEETKNETTGE